MFNDCQMVVLIWGQNTWNTIPISEQKIHWIFKHWIVKHWIEPKHWINKSRTMKLEINNTGTEWLSVFEKCWIVTVQYLLGLNIFVITELTIATLFCWCVSSWGISSCAAEFHFLPAGSLVALWKINGTPQDPMWWWRWWWVRTCRANHKSMWQYFVVLRVKCQKVGLNKRPIAYTAGGGAWFSPNAWSRDTETDGQCDTRRVIRLTWGSARKFNSFK
jgi:hypothetical protein